MTKDKKVKVSIVTKTQMRGCPQGKLNNDHGTPEPKCK